jgi:putative Ca2+/H+ antiporter (TMEM165/GDT1 family)
MVGTAHHTGLLMNWQLLGLTFMTVFIAEIGDKSQLAAIALGGSTQHPRAVFFGSVVALLLASSIGVLAGGEIAAFLPTKVLKGFAALGFALMAVRLLWPEAE